MVERDRDVHRIPSHRDTQRGAYDTEIEIRYVDDAEIAHRKHQLEHEQDDERSAEQQEMLTTEQLVHPSEIVHRHRQPVPHAREHGKQQIVTQRCT